MAPSALISRSRELKIYLVQPVNEIHAETDAVGVLMCTFNNPFRQASSIQTPITSTGAVVQPIVWQPQIESCLVSSRLKITGQRFRIQQIVSLTGKRNDIHVFSNAAHQPRSN